MIKAVKTLKKTIENSIDSVKTIIIDNNITTFLIIFLVW
jgi:hypothetical protein